MVAIVQKITKQPSCDIVDFYLYAQMDLFNICKFELLWLEVSVKYLILRWPLSLVGLLFMLRRVNLCCQYWSF